MEIHRAQNAAHASIKSRFACTWSVSSSGYVKTNRAVIIISLAFRTCDFNKRILIQLNRFEKIDDPIAPAFDPAKLSNQQTTDNIVFISINSSPQKS
jgi:hypothetical protein